MSGRLAGEVALVTGSTMGVGEAIARRFAAEGAHVIVHGPELEAAAAVAESISAAGGRAASVAGDLADPAVPAELAASAIEVCGRVDILVNNAASKARGDVESTDTAAFDQMMAVNARAPLSLIRALLPQFRAQGGASVLNIGSVHAHGGGSNLLAYSMSKGALMTMTRNLGDALAEEGIRVNQLNLGWVLTETEKDICRAQGFPDDWPDNVPAGIAPSGRLLDPDDIAHFALSFVERSSHRVSGAVVEIEQYPVIGRMREKRTVVPPTAAGER